jgi:hypothetical protein
MQFSPQYLNPEHKTTFNFPCIICQKVRIISIVKEGIIEIDGNYKTSQDKEYIMMTILIVVLSFIAFDLAAQHWGFDSREREAGPELLGGYR